MNTIDLEKYNNARRYNYDNYKPEDVSIERNAEPGLPTKGGIRTCWLPQRWFMVLVAVLIVFIPLLIACIIFLAPVKKPSGTTSTTATAVPTASVSSSTSSSTPTST
jgi:hypothetical protein